MWGLVGGKQRQVRLWGWEEEAQMWADPVVHTEARSIDFALAAPFPPLKLGCHAAVSAPIICPVSPVNSPGASPQVRCPVDVHHQLLPHVRDDDIGGCVAATPQVLEQGAQLTHADIACRGRGVEEAVAHGRGAAPLTGVQLRWGEAVHGKHVRQGTGQCKGGE